MKYNSILILIKLIFFEVIFLIVGSILKLFELIYEIYFIFYSKMLY